MSFDRVLPPPAAGLRNDSTPVSLPRPSNLIDHKIMNDRPKYHGALPYRAESTVAAGKHADMHSSGAPQAHQHMASFNGPKSAIAKFPSDGSALPFSTDHPLGPTVSTREYAVRDRSSSSGSSSPVKEDDHFCLCQPEKKVPRPRNGESMLSAPSSNEHGKCFLFWF